MSVADCLLRDAQATERFGKRLAVIAQPGDVIALSGPLGAGKTCMARGLLAALGLTGDAPSPSFAIVQPYDPPETSFPILHVDLYRVEHGNELAELGLDEAQSASLLIVEWPERAGRDYWPQALWLTIEILADGARRLTAQVPASWEARWPRI